MADKLTIVAVGDTGVGGERSGEGAAFSSKVGAASKKKPDLFGQLKKVAPVLQQGDFTVGNLEGTVCESLPQIESKAGTGGAMIRMPPEAADAMKKAGFAAMTVANNHMMDFGVEGLLQTLSNMKRAGIRSFGGGRNIAEAREPVILENGGVKVGLLGYTSTFVAGVFPAGEKKPGLACVGVNTSYQIPGNIMYAPGAPPCIVTTPKAEDRDRMLEDVRKLRKKADVVVVHWHWGLSRYASATASHLPIEDTLFYVCNYQEDMGRAAVDAGADLVIGHHPHRLQGVEVYKGKVICYSLSILTMPFAMKENFGEESVILKAFIDRKSRQITGVSLVPIMVPADTMQPYIVPAAKAGAIFSQMERLSRSYKTRFKLEKGEIEVKLA